MRLLKIIYFAVHERMPPAIADRLLEVWSKTFIRKFLRKRRAARLRAAKARAIATHGKVASAELAGVLRAAGVSAGDILFFQCSFNDLYTFEGSPVALLQLLRNLIGPSGTLLMPAYTHVSASRSQPFRPADDATYTGIVSEIFRRSPGVIRSLHPRHSICGVGPMAEHLLAQHQSCARADGPDSPFDRMRRLPESKILTLGMPRGCISFLHWVEDFEPEKLPLVVHRAAQITCSIEMPDGKLLPVQDLRARADAAARLSIDRLFQRVSADACRFMHFKGIAIGIYPMMQLARELLALRDDGVIHYH
jgi:aminoglycoside N3'-acetyltransferase